jgi:twitching motility protein PilT
MREIDRLLELAVQRGASDLHLRIGEPPILRIDGEIHRLSAMPVGASQTETLIGVTMTETARARFADQLDADYAYEVSGLGRFRVNALRDRRGMAAVFRHIPSSIVTADAIDLPLDVQRLAELRRGLVLVTGPTGSGKSTTLCALIDRVNESRREHIVTIEDPIEFVHEGKRCVVTQREVGQDARSFKHALRAALREDPDIVLIGEMRDLETVSIALETAETGHLVFATLHTTTAAGTVDRIIDQFPMGQQEQIRSLVADSLVAVISQTLCRRIGGGRVAAREVLMNTTPVANLIRENKTCQIGTIMQTSRAHGMITLNAALESLVERHLIEAQEAVRHASDKAGLVAALNRKGIPLVGVDPQMETRVRVPLHGQLARAV